MKRLVTIALAAVALRAAPSEAKRFTNDVTKTARRGDVASQYVLRADGSLLRQIGRNLCQVTSDVEEFKVAQHPSDPTAIYIVRKGALEALTVTDDTLAASACPRATLQTLIPALDRADGEWTYKVVDRKDTPLSLVAKDTRGRVTAWDQEGVAVSIEGAVDLAINPCFGSKKSFSSYVAFLLDRDGRVAKIGGKDPRRSKPDTQRYESLDAFRGVNQVCR